MTFLNQQILATAAEISRLQEIVLARARLVAERAHRNEVTNWGELGDLNRAKEALLELIEPDGESHDFLIPPTHHEPSESED